MSKYGYSVYGGAKYGLTPKLAYSVEPMGINVVRFDEVLLTWQLPTGTFTRFRVVRNQNGYPETSEDGVIIFEQNSLDGTSLDGSVSRSSIYDGLENPTQTPITPGRNIFYRVFLYTSDDVWVRAGQISEIVPEDTGATNKLINLLPRVLTSSTLSPLGVVDESSDLYKFLDGIAFSYEQMSTEIKLSRPSHNLDISNYTTIPGEVLNVGLNPEPNLPVLRQRALIREAIGLYASKGTPSGVAAYAEALTGFAPTITMSKNLMLSIQDSTFYDSIGRWVDTNATLSATDEMAPNTNADLAIDDVYTLKIVASGAGEISLGEDNPITQGIPLKEDTEYTFSMEMKCPAGNATMTFVAEFYDKDGTFISDESASNPATNAWTSIGAVWTTPLTTSYAVLRIQWNSAKTYYVDRVFVGEGAELPYDEARVATIELAPQMINYIYNPSFEVGFANWTATGATATQDANVPGIGYPGSSSGKFVASGNWTIECDNQLTLETGIYFTVSHYTKSSNITTVTSVIETYDSEDTLLDTYTEDLDVTNSWERLAHTILVPAGSTATYAKFRLEGAAGTLYLDMVQAQDAYTPTDYVDGSLPETFGAIWEGTEHNSATLYYPNKSTKILRLAQTLVNWMPMNAWWRVTTPAGLEYTNLDV